MPLLISCAHKTQSLSLSEDWFVCPGRTFVPGAIGDELPDADIGALLRRERGRGDACAQRLHDLEQELRKQGVVIDG